MSILANLTSDTSIAAEKDSVGGNAALESGLYPSTITMAHVTKSSGGAVGLVVSLMTEAKKEIRQTLWMTSGTAKNCANFYIDKNGEKNYLPGFLQASALCLLTVGKEVSAMDTEPKVIKLYNAEAKAEVPTKVDALVDLIGKEILVGLIKQTVDKTKKNEATGVYEATGETRDENEIDKLFRAKDRMTTAEIRAQVEEASFVDTWVAKNTGNTRNKAKGVTGTAGVPKAAGSFGTGAVAAKKPATSLFA